MSEVKEYRVVRGKLGRHVDGEAVLLCKGGPHGDRVMLTAQEARDLGNRVELVVGGVAQSVESESETTVNPWAEFLNDNTVSATEEVIANLDAADVQVLLEAETAETGRKRKGIIDAVEHRLRQLQAQA